MTTDRAKVTLVGENDGVRFCVDLRKGQGDGESEGNQLGKHGGDRGDVY